MTERRVDDLTAVNVEYAIFLAATRGTAAGLKFSHSMKLPPDVFARMLESRLARRTEEDRRAMQREQ